MQFRSFIFVGILLVLIVFVSGCISIDSFSDDSRNLSIDKYQTDILPKVHEYNQSRGAENASIEIQGTPLIINDPEYPNFSLNNIDPNENYIFFNTSNATLFIIVDQKENLINNETYVNQNNGNTTNYEFKEYVTDIIVIYYPSLKYAGWYRLVNEPETPQESYTISNGTGFPQTGYVDLFKWIRSLPGYNSSGNTSIQYTHNYATSDYDF